MTAAAAVAAAALTPQWRQWGMSEPGAASPAAGRRVCGASLRLVCSNAGTSAMRAGSVALTLPGPLAGTMRSPGIRKAAVSGVWVLLAWLRSLAGWSALGGVCEVFGMHSVGYGRGMWACAGCGSENVYS